MNGVSSSGRNDLEAAGRGRGEWKVKRQRAGNLWVVTDRGAGSAAGFVAGAGGYFAGARDETEWER